MMYVMCLQHTLSALLRVETGLELASNGLEVGSHDCEEEEEWALEEMCQGECLVQAIEASTFLERPAVNRKLGLQPEKRVRLGGARPRGRAAPWS